MISIIIPANFEPYLQKTIDSLLKNARGEIEILPILDGWEPDEPLKVDPRVRVIKLEKYQGMRAAINRGIKEAKGEFIMKCDAHCAFGEGYDTTLSQNCQEKWLVIPRRYSLDEVKWEKTKLRWNRDYHYLTFPTPSPKYGIIMSNLDWPELTAQKTDPKYDVDDTMSFQGSCWMANKKYFLERVGQLDDRAETYTPFGGEPVEIGLKYWLGGGEIKIIKKAWYAHLSKRKHHYQTKTFSRKYKYNQAAARTWSSKHWMNNEEPGMIHPLSWLVEKFWPVPTWPEDRSLWVFPSEAES